VTGGATIHRDETIKFASVGPPAPGIDIRIAGDGEIQIAGPTVMQGYYKDPDTTARDILTDADGRRWFRTGDAGTIDDDGHLIYLDRVKDMLTLAGGAAEVQPLCARRDGHRRRNARFRHGADHYRL